MNSETQHTESGNSPPQRHRLTPPPPAECVEIYRRRYPEALVCIECGALLATLAASYVKSNLTEAQRLAYVCGECQWEAAEAARVKALKAEIGRRTITAARDAKTARKAGITSPTGPNSNPARRSASERHILAAKTSRSSYDPAVQGGRGRPPVPEAVRKQKARERQRAYRQRQTSQVTA